MLEISCVIPTYNGSRVIAMTLDGLSNQSYSGQFEVVIVNDGSIDKTSDIVNNYIKKFKGNKVIWQYIFQENKGPSSARNNGVKNARGKYIVFLGDDTIAERDLLTEHLNLLKSNKDVCSIGIVKWHKETENKRFKALKISGIEIDYDDIRDPKNCEFTYFCTANVALERKHLLENLFDESFVYAAMEDTELGYQLSKRNIKFILNKEAIVSHLHHYEKADLIRRQEKIGKSVAILIKKHPELRKRFVKPNAKFLFLFCFFLVKSKFIKYINKNFYWIALSTYSKYKFLK